MIEESVRNLVGAGVMWPIWGNPFTANPFDPFGFWRNMQAFNPWNQWLQAMEAMSEFDLRVAVTRKDLPEGEALAVGVMVTPRGRCTPQLAEEMSRGNVIDFFSRRPLELEARAMPEDK